MAEPGAPVDAARRRLLRGGGDDAPLVHVASFVVRAFADRMAAVRAHIDARPHLECIAAEGTRLVLVAEVPSERHLMELLAELEAIPGVLNAALVYHHAETAAQLEEVVPHAVHPT